VTIGQGGWKPEKYSEENLIVMEVYEGISGHGHFVERMLGGRIIVIFHLNPIDNSLRDITINAYGFDL
jgi:hypothetical protein